MFFPYIVTLGTHHYQYFHKIVHKFLEMAVRQSHLQIRLYFLYLSHTLFNKNHLGKNLNRGHN